ncbi:hypothetical protein ES332_A09G073000v1 [Gossypium tomentosum]|uniref:HR-like lesion-inducer n=1 Tax=Gossypium tomentosum TaxID=34277 RepID=A0A5D2P4F0_GOSTO|nr:hypothetical protein ES332_A09G073000v1 [Gossypium tomentosum]
MALVSFIGRVLFASVFILSAWQEFNEFGVDGGPAVTKVQRLLKDCIKYVVAAAVAFKGVGSILFTFGSTIGAYLLVLHQLILTPIVYDFYNYEKEKKEFGLLFTKFSQNLALLGALLFFIGMKNSIPTRQLKKKAPKTKTV